MNNFFVFPPVLLLYPLILPPQSICCFLYFRIRRQQAKLRGRNPSQLSLNIFLKYYILRGSLRRLGCIGDWLKCLGIFKWSMIGKIEKSNSFGVSWQGGVWRNLAILGSCKPLQYKLGPWCGLTKIIIIHMIHPLNGHFLGLKLWGEKLFEEFQGLKALAFVIFFSRSSYKRPTDI